MREYTASITDAGSPPNTRHRAIVYSGSRHTALSQPAFEQCPFSGARRRAHFGLDRSAHEPSIKSPSTFIPSAKTAIVPPTA